MSDSITDFRSGNKWIVAALNKVIAYARGHGVNPAGIPGWSWTVDGWQPPRVTGSEGSAVDPWDIVKAPDSDGLLMLRSPFCVWSHGDLDTDVAITNEPFALGAGKWVVAKALGPIGVFVETPSLEILVVDEWEWYPSAHKFEESEPNEWIESYLPIWKLAADGDQTPDMVKVGTSDDGVIYGKRYIDGVPRLSITLSQTPIPAKLRSVPEFF